MIPKLIEIRYLTDYRVWLRFADGVQGEVDLAHELWGEVFEPLKDTDYFQRFFLEGGTVAWPNGADVAPETLYAQPGVEAAA